MKFRAVAVASAALATVGLMLGPAAYASGPVQVTGNQLRSALLPASAFGSGYSAGPWATSGGKLWHAPAVINISKVSCRQFENNVVIIGLGQTATALSFVVNPNPFPDYPNTQFYYAQWVYQFASAKQASSFYTQAHAKYAKCKDFTEPVPGNTVPGGGTLETTTQSISKTSVGRYQAFAVGQTSNLTNNVSITFQLNTLVTVEGTDVLEILSVGGTNDVVPVSLMKKLIGRVQKLR